MKTNNWLVPVIIFVVLVMVAVFMWPGPQIHALKATDPVPGPQGEVGPQGPQGEVGPQGPAGTDGKNTDPAEVLALMQSDPSFLLAVKHQLSAPTIDNPYMTAYQNTLEYMVSDELQVPSDLLEGFTPVASLVKTELMVNDKKVVVPAVPEDVTPYFCFPQDYSVSDQFNPGCRQAQLAGLLPWKTPIAGYNDGDNRFSDTPDGWTAEDIQAFDWKVYDGWQVCHPSIGCLQDPDGGAVLITIVNFLDSDEVWNVRNSSAVFADSGFTGYGVMWDLSGGTYDVGEGIADVRNHFIYKLAYPDTKDDNHLRGQCGSSSLCKTVTYVTVARVWDRSDLGINFSHFELLDYGQWVRPAADATTK